LLLKKEGKHSHIGEVQCHFEQVYSPPTSEIIISRINQFADPRRWRRTELQDASVARGSSFPGHVQLVWTWMDLVSNPTKIIT